MRNTTTAAWMVLTSLCLTTDIFAETGGYSIGLNFGTDRGGATLNAADVAGQAQVKQANWNNLANATGSTTNIMADTNGTSVATAVAVGWTSPNTWASTGVGEENNGGFTGTDHALMTGYLDTGGSTTTWVTVSNLPPALTGPGYNVYVYFLGGVAGGRGGGYFVADGATNLLTPIILAQGEQNPATYDQVTTNFTATGGTYGVGDFIVFTGLKSPNIVVGASTDDPFNTGAALGTGGTPRAPLDAIQIVAANQTPFPVFLSILANGRGFSQAVDDFPPVIVNTNTIAVQLDGTNIAVTVTKPASETTMSFDSLATQNRFLASGSTHTVQVTLKDMSGKSYTNTTSFTVPVYGTVPSDYATTQADTTSPGFAVRTFAMDARRGPGDPNSIGNAEQELVGGFLDPATGLPLPNTANLAGASNGVFYVTNVINFEINGGDINANPPQPDHFNSGNSYPNAPFPGIPSGNVTQPGTEDFACEITAYVNLKRGYYRMGVNSDDGFTVSVAPGQADSLGLMLGDFPGGRGAGDTVFDFAATQDGVYPFRLSFWQGTGGGNLEWWTRDLQTGTYHLLNDRTDSAALVTYSKGHARAHLQSISPANGFAGAQPTNSIIAVLQDDGTTIASNSVSLTLDGTAVSPAITKSGGTTTVTYKPSQAFAFGSTHTGALVYQESTTPTTTWTNNFTFSIRLEGPDDLPANSFWIESEDWDFGGGQTMAAASTMPYGGGVYQTSGTDTTKFNIDYHNDDAKDSQTYRSGGDLDVANGNGTFIQNVDTTDNANGRFGSLRPGGFTMTDDWRIGWINPGDWCNYTRTLPTNVYSVYAALSHGDPAGTPHDQRGSLALVTSGWGTLSQTTVTLGTFDAPASGNWGDNTLVKMQAPDGSDAVIKLGGTNTLRFNIDGGDFDWFVLTPAVSAAKILSASPVPSVHGEPRNTPIDIAIANLSTSVATNTVKLSLDGQDITSGSVIKINAGQSGNGSIVTVHYQPVQLLAVGTNSYTLTFSDTGTPAKQTTFTGTFVVDPRATPGQFLIEAEDFDFGGGKTTNTASAMPYLGGAFNGLSATLNVDYFNNDNQESEQYRVGGDLDVAGQGSNMDPGPGDFNRGSWTNVVNHKVGWIDSSDWFNYTRTFPTNNYQVWVALSHGDPTGTAHRLMGTIGLVTGGVGSSNQIVQVLGTCDAPSTGTWGLNNLVPMTDTNGTAITVPLGGAETVQFRGNSGDYDYLLFVPGTAAPAGPKFSSIKASGGNLVITWSGGGTLQQASSSGGPWSPVMGAASPATVLVGSNKTLYFRVQQ